MTRQTIRNGVRNITGRKSVTQMTDAVLDNFIDSFYLYDFPEQLKTLELEGWYRLQLQPNVDRYLLTSGWLSSGQANNANIQVTQNDQLYFLNQPVYIDGYESSLQQDPTIFYRIWPDLKFIEQADTGDGTTGPFAFTLTNLPVEQGSLIISAGSQSTRDDGAGGWQEAGYAGSVNYLTGAVSISFPSAVAIGVSIDAHYYPYVASRPRDILFFEQALVFRPIPDRAYEFRAKTQRRPMSMPSADSSPEFVEWNDLITYGTALKIFIQDADWDEYNNLLPIFEKQKNLAQRRALKQLRDQRASTPYDTSNIQQAFWPIYPSY